MKRIITIAFIWMLGIQNSKGQIVLQRCDYTTNWTSSNTLTIDNADYKEGRGSLSSTGDGTNWFTKVFSQANVGIDETGFLKLWLYVSDVSAFDTDGQIEISSSGNPDADEYSWDISSLGLSNGWNSVVLSISSANVTGSPDLKAINFFRIYQQLSVPIGAKLDLIRFSNTAEQEIPDNILDIKSVDHTTLDGKVMFGYQGWFSAIGDGSKTNRYHHWGNLETGSGSPSDLSVEMWFDDREFDPDELYATGYNYPDGRMARAFSAYNKKTVVRHMKWLRDYDLDGVFLQRFLSEAQDPSFLDLRDSVTVHVMEGSERYGRTFSIMWDGINYGSNMVEDLKNDWKHLVDDLKVTESPNYLHHRGLPLISLWGFSVREEATVAQLNQLIDFFHNNPEEKYRASIKVGCNQDWINRTEWRNAFRNIEVISPWTVGRYGDKAGYENFANKYMTPAQKWCDDNNVDFLPVNWPGFSWYNLHDGPKNQHKRRGGDFFWEQASGNLSRGAKSLYLAMFDEVDEGTSFFKMPENATMSPDKGYWLALDADGLTLPSDWFLRSANLATEVTKGHTDNRVFLETPDDGIDVFTMKAIHGTCGLTNGGLVLGYPNTDSNPIMKFSIDGGVTYEYTTPASSESLVISGLPEKLYNVWVSFEDDSYPTDLGDVLIVNVVPQVEIDIQNASCLDNGILEITVFDNPYIGELELSFDNGENFNYSIEEGIYWKGFEGLAPGTYQVWARWKDFDCETSIGTYEIVSNVTPPVAAFTILGKEVEGGICSGSEVHAVASTSNSAQSWKWTGPDGFSANTASVLISDSVTVSQLGTYTVEYTASDGCKKSTSLVLEANGNMVPEVDFLIEMNLDYFDPSTTNFCEGDGLILEGRPVEDTWDFSWSGPNNFSKTGRRATLTGAATLDKTGEYKLHVIDNNGCVGTISKEVVINEIDACVTSIEDNNFEQIASVFPNPNTGVLNVNFSSNKAVELEILDVQGRVLVQKELSNERTKKIDISDLSSGLFFLKIKDNQGRNFITRIVKE
ncbi:MAG: T9SS type A sorting domain-containing protein [Reichenbachiella sp.]